MTTLVAHGATLRCSEGTTQSSLSALVQVRAGQNKKRLALVDDHQPMTHIQPFGMCNSTLNPQVMAATAAAQGTHTPMSCVPLTTSAWSPGAPQIKVDAVELLTSDSTCRCAWNGTIEIDDAACTIQVRH